MGKNILFCAIMVHLSLSVKAAQQSQQKVACPIPAAVSLDVRVARAEALVRQARNMLKGAEPVQKLHLLAQSNLLHTQLQQAIATENRSFRFQLYVRELAFELGILSTALFQYEEMRSYRSTPDEVVATLEQGLSNSEARFAKDLQKINNTYDEGMRVARSIRSELQVIQGHAAGEGAYAASLAAIDLGRAVDQMEAARDRMKIVAEGATKNTEMVEELTKAYQLRLAAIGRARQQIAQLRIGAQ